MCKFDIQIGLSKITYITKYSRLDNSITHIAILWVEELFEVIDVWFPFIFHHFILWNPYVLIKRKDTALN